MNLDAEADELLPVLDAHGARTGHSKTRGQIHRDGDWHPTRTVWAILVAEAAGPLVVFQKRGAHKDAFPGLLDASSAGHVTLRDDDRWRECEEELGVRPSDTDILLPLGVRRSETQLSNDRVDRELQELWLWLCRRGLGELRPPAPEVEALVAVPLDAAPGLVRGELAALAADARLPGGVDPTPRMTIAAADFIPGSAAYVAHICDLAARAVAGDRKLAFDPTVERFESGRAGAPAPARPGRRDGII